MVNKRGRLILGSLVLFIVLAGVIFIFNAGFVRADMCLGDIYCPDFNNSEEMLNNPPYYTCSDLEYSESCSWEIDDYYDECSSYDGDEYECESGMGWPDCEYDWNTGQCTKDCSEWDYDEYGCENEYGCTYDYGAWECVAGEGYCYYGINNADSCSLFDNSQTNCEATSGCTWEEGCIDDGDCPSGEECIGLDNDCTGTGKKVWPTSDFMDEFTKVASYDGTDPDIVPGDEFAWTLNTFYYVKNIDTHNCDQCSDDTRQAMRVEYTGLSGENLYQWTPYFCSCPSFCISGNNCEFVYSETYTYTSPAIILCSDYTTESQCESGVGCSWTPDYGTCVEECPPLDAPVATEATNVVEDVGLTAHWNSVSGAIDYYLTVKESNYGWTVFSGWVGDQTSAEIEFSPTDVTGEDIDTAYYYFFVQAKDRCDQISDFSNTIYACEGYDGNCPVCWACSGGSCELDESMCQDGEICSDEGICVQDLAGECEPCTLDSDCVSGHCAALDPLGSTSICVPTDTCANTDSAPNCYSNSGATECVGVDKYTCQPYSWSLTEANSIDCDAGSPSLTWRDPNTNEEIPSAEIGGTEENPEFPTVRLVLEDYSGDAVSFDIKERFDGTDYNIKSGVSQTGDYYYTWTLTQSDLDAGPQNGEGTDYRYYVFYGDIYSGSLTVTDDRISCNNNGICETGEDNSNCPNDCCGGDGDCFGDQVCDTETGECVDPPTYCGDGRVQEPNDDGFNEECDNGENNGQVCTPNCEETCYYCESDCTQGSVTGDECISDEGYCGDGITQRPNGDGVYEECDGEIDCADDCTWIKDMYWTWVNGTKITSRVYLDAETMMGQTFKAYLINPSSNPGTFTIMEYDALNRDDLIRSGMEGYAGSWYTSWTLTNADFDKTTDDGSVYRFYFEVDEESSRDYDDGTLVIEVEGDTPSCNDDIQNGDEEGIDCGGSCPDPCPEGALICSDYEDQSTCEDFDQEVADNSVEQPILEGETAICEWNISSDEECYGKKLISVNDITIGACINIDIPNEDDCEDGALTYSWEEVWQWADANDYPSESNCLTANEITEGCITVEGRWHYDPNGDSISCGGIKSNTIPCPAQVKLSFFSWKNLVIALVVIGLVYLSVLELRKNRKKVKKIEKKQKEKRKKKGKK